MQQRKVDERDADRKHDKQIGTQINTEGEINHL